MKKILYFLVLMPLIIFSGCDDCDCDNDDNEYQNKILMLKVNYVTFDFEGGIEYVFNQKTDSFNLDLVYFTDTLPATFFLIYKELNETLLTGTVHWDNSGEILSPRSLLSPEYFETVSTEDIVFPTNGFTNVSLSGTPGNYEYFNVWLSVQKLEKVRKFLRSNPEQKVKIFLYTPNGSYGYYHSYYYIFIQN